MTHGWPSLPVEYVPVIEQLRARERHGGGRGSPTLVAPRCPGFGWSSAPSSRCMPDIARLWRLLIDEGLELGPVIAHGGDWGAVVSSWLAVDAPERVAGLHLTMMGLKPDIDASDPLDDAERSPDSPPRNGLPWMAVTANCRPAGHPRCRWAGRLASIRAGMDRRKLHQWSGPAAQQDPERLQSAILTLASSYWLTGSRAPPRGSTGPTATRRKRWLAASAAWSLPIPGFGGGFFPPPPSRWIERAHRLIYRNEHPVGGHFPGWMASAALADELQRFTIALNT